jgi:hypothetical protein
VVIGDRQAYNDLAAVVLAKLSTVLSGQTNRMLVSLGPPMVSARIGPCLSMTAARGRHRREHRAIRPVSFYEVMQRLYASRLHTRSHIDRRHTLVGSSQHLVTQ